MKEPLSVRLQWLPNFITVSRLLVMVVAFIFVLHDKWAIGFWLLLAALSTDFLDGLAAKKLNAMSKIGEQLDGLIDSAVVVLGILSLSLTDHLSWWISVSIFVITAIIGSDRAFDQPLWRWRAVVAVASLFLAWIGIVWFYAYLAFGWSWLYVPITLITLIACGLLKRHRIRTWLRS